MIWDATGRFGCGIGSRIVFDCADMLLARNGRGGHDKSTAMLDKSQASTELGMRPLMERVLSRRDILKA